MSESKQIKQPGIRLLLSWLNEANISQVAGWRLRKKGWLKTVNICGRVYVTDEAIAEFKRRAEAGEFAKKHKVPAPPQRKVPEVPKSNLAPTGTEYISRKLLTEEDLAAKLQCHPDTVRALEKQGLPFIKLVRLKRYDEMLVDEWIRNRAVSKIVNRHEKKSLEPNQALSG